MSQRGFRRGCTQERPLETLRRFDQQVHELCDRRLLKPGNLDTRLHARRLDNGQFEMSFRNPDEEHLRSLTMDLRLFLMENSPVFLNRVLSIARQHITEESLVEVVDTQHKEWNRARREGHARLLQERGPAYTSMDVLNIWINGRYFHLDDEKARAADDLEEVAMTRHMLIVAVASGVNAVVSTGIVVRVALRDGYISATPVR